MCKTFNLQKFKRQRDKNENDLNGAKFLFNAKYCLIFVIFSLKTASNNKPHSGTGRTGMANNTSNITEASNGLAKSTPSSTDDMNSALLKCTNESPNGSAGRTTDALSNSNDPALSNGMFGKFKGFTLRPLSDVNTPAGNLFNGPNVAYVQPTPQDNSISSSESGNGNGIGPPHRSAPPPPVKQISNFSKRIPNATNISSGPALSPPNPGTHSRPLISLPVLENSTMKLPLNGTELTPCRPAPPVPEIHQSMKWTAAPPVPLHTDPRLNVRRDGTIRRITSFLKKNDEKTTLPFKEKAYIDRERLKHLEISAPIPVTIMTTAITTGMSTSTSTATTSPGSTTPAFVESSNSDSETTTRDDETKNLVKRTQSMRSPSNKKLTNIQTFGSMRQTTSPALSAATATAAHHRLKNSSSIRPKSPPPRPPPLKKTSSTTSSGYQVPLTSEITSPVVSGLNNDRTYDDCEYIEEPVSKEVKDALFCSSKDNDNIYAVIDEIPPASETLRRSELVGCKNANGSVDTKCDLLDEIVNEFEKRSGGGRQYHSSGTALKYKDLTKEFISSKAKETTNESNRVKAGGNGSLLSSTTTATSATPILRPTAVTTPVARVAPTRSDVSPTVSTSVTSNGFSSFKPSPSIVNSGQRIFTTHITSSSASSGAGARRTPSVSQKQRGTTAAAATIQKPKPLSAKPSLINQQQDKGAVGSSTQLTEGRNVTPTAVKPPVVSVPTHKSSKVATLTQRFEKSQETSDSLVGRSKISNAGLNK